MSDLMHDCAAAQKGDAEALERLLRRAHDEILTAEPMTDGVRLFLFAALRSILSDFDADRRPNFNRAFGMSKPAHRPPGTRSAEAALAVQLAQEDGLSLADAKQRVASETGLSLEAVEKYFRRHRDYAEAVGPRIHAEAVLEADRRMAEKHGISVDRVRALTGRSPSGQK